MRLFSYLSSVYLYQFFFAVFKLFLWPLSFGLPLDSVQACCLVGGYCWSATHGDILGTSGVCILQNRGYGHLFDSTFIIPSGYFGGYVKLYGALGTSGWKQSIADMMPIRWSFETLVVGLKLPTLQTQNENILSLRQIIGFSSTEIGTPLLVLGHSFWEPLLFA